MPASSTIRVDGIAKQKLAALRRQARKLGMSLEGYARQLIEDGLSLDQLARMKTFDELYASVRARMREGKATEAELDRLVDRARTRHSRQTSRKRG